MTPSSLSPTNYYCPPHLVHFFSRPSASLIKGTSAHRPPVAPTRRNHPLSAEMTSLDDDRVRWSADSAVALLKPQNSYNERRSPLGYESSYESLNTFHESNYEPREAASPQPPGPERNIFFGYRRHAQHEAGPGEVEPLAAVLVTPPVRQNTTKGGTAKGGRSRARPSPPPSLVVGGGGRGRVQRAPSPTTTTFDGATYLEVLQSQQVQQVLARRALF